MRTPYLYLAFGLLLASSGSGFTACSKQDCAKPTSSKADCKSDSTKTKTTITKTGVS
ncbi:hypothetical protein GO988_07730 [Hymenobacter sp. HMF4947]|uniref:Uncharacterized protein n=1 Tax=Hymenobacter ginkgonis TaxID=2682976 RepID=A0A7K1TDG7_9BACT|nr:hypothetical protein [Hymenobacter ginkgonis]MVN76211.1 hypothetical protein [Hymenobacter ginkgonis]